MDNLLDRIDKLLVNDESGATLTGNVATQTGKGKIDVIGMRYRKKKRKNKYGTDTIVHEDDEECPDGEHW